MKVETLEKLIKFFKKHKVTEVESFGKDVTFSAYCKNGKTIQATVQYYNNRILTQVTKQTTNEIKEEI